jgi:hypothetical protein
MTTFSFSSFMVIMSQLFLSSTALAQDERPVSVLDLPREGYEPVNVRLGPVTVAPTLDMKLEYDNNIFAQPFDKVGDVVFTATPRLKFAYDNEKLLWSAEAASSFYRYFDNKSENHTGFLLNTGLTLKGKTSNAGVNGGFERTYENRNDPEARKLVGTGPRLFNIATAEAFYSVQGARVGLSAKATVQKYNFLSNVDDERDFTSLRGSLRGTYRVSGPINMFGQIFANRRAFRLNVDASGVNRDATSYGALIGAQIDPGGKVRGEFGVGIVHLNPKDNAIKGYTGAEVLGTIVYNLRPRTAVTLDLFRGDVATVRNGASGRVDSRIRLGVQQEVRHNLLMSGGIGWRETHFRAVPDGKQRTLGVDGEVEYLLNRGISVALTSRYSKRTADIPATGPSPNVIVKNGVRRSVDAFERFRIGMDVRFKL